MTSSTTSEALVPLVAVLTGVAACGDAVDPSSGSGGGGGAVATICEAKPDHKPISIRGGDRSIVAVLDDGTLYCWGENTTGQCDAESFYVVLSHPRRVVNLPCVTRAAAGNAGIAMTADGRAYTWGVEVRGERGEGSGPSPSPTEPTLLPMEGVTDVTANSAAMGLIAAGRA